MSQNLISIGVGVFRSSEQTETKEQAIRELVARALHQVEGETLPVRYALLFATVDWCGAATPLPAEVRRCLKERLGYEVPLIGGSTAGLYCSTEEAEPFIKQGLALVLFCSNDMWLTVTSLPQPYATTPEERKQKLIQLAAKLDEQAGIRLGATANKFLFGYLPGIVADARGRCAYYDHELHQDILDAFHHRYLLFGASATSELDQASGYQFANDECLESGLALGLIETDLCLGAALAHGFTGRSQVRTLVGDLAGADSQGTSYEITILDGKPVAERLLELKNAGLIKLDRPVFGLPYGDEYNTYWPLPPTTEADTLRLKRKVALGDSLYLLEATPEQLLEVVPQTIEHAIARSSVDASELRLFLCFTCGGRLKQYEMKGIDWKETVREAQRKYPNIPFVGVISAGEFGINAQRQMRADNMSLNVICQANAYWRRAFSRNLQRKLVRAASHLLNCESPKEVMREALHGAVEAGASGGKINLVDHQLGRILGKGFGDAWSSPGSAQDWVAVAKHTDYPIPTQCGGDFPIELRADAMSVVPDLSFPLNYVELSMPNENKRGEDILELVVRTLHAVFIPDCRDYEQYGLSNAKARAEGNIISQLVIPLVGSQFKVIATIQLSFPDNKLDRESLALWISYAQQVAAALEHAEEFEQRQIVGKIMRLGNHLMHAPLGNNFDPHDWCQQYITKVVELLDADGGHIRTLRIGYKDEESDEYRLRAATGLLADLLRKTRYKISVSDGSFRKQQFEFDAIFVNTRKDVAEFNAGISARENIEEYGGKLAQRLDEISATALLPLRGENRLLGSLVIDCKREYFFTTRRQQIAKAAAEQAGAILQSKRTEHFRAHLLKGLEGLANVRTDFLKGLTQTAAPTAHERLQSTLKRVCHITGADVASIFAWYEKPQKLLLHCCHNWYQPLVGQAEYGKNEGWTGSLVEETDEISIHRPGPEIAQRSLRKYYKQMIPPLHDYEGREARIGVQLKDGKNLVGVLTLLYYKTNGETLNEQIATIEPFLRGVTTVVTLGLEAALREVKEARTHKFFAVKDQVFDLLINRQWQPALTVMRQDFQVERVTFYHWHTNKLELGWSDQATSHLAPNLSIEPMELLGALREVVFEKKSVLISAPDDCRLRDWPNGNNARNLLAVPMVTLDGELQGVLEFVNQQEDMGHPYEFFDELEQEFAADFARFLADALQSDEKASALDNLRSQLTTATKIGARGLFSAIVMHQVLSPFANMRSTIDWLQRHPDSSPDERAGRLKRIETFYNQALETIQRAARRGAPGMVQREKLHTLVREAYRFVEPEISGLRVKVRIKNELRVEVEVDLWSIVGALINLLSNALDAMEGSGVLSISTWRSADENKIFIRIHNTCATPPTEADIARYLQPGQSSKEGDTHLGLGLPLAKQAIESAAGTLTLRLAAEGIEAVVSLPVADKREP